MEVEVTAPPPQSSGHRGRRLEAYDSVPTAPAPAAQFRGLSSASSPGPSGDCLLPRNSQFPRQFRKWSETPAPEGVPETHFFLEVFSGSANLTLSMRQAGWNTLPCLRSTLRSWG